MTAQTMDWPSPQLVGMKSQGADWRQYITASQMEIRQLLHTMQRATIIITASLDGADDFFLTSVLALDQPPGTLTFECGLDRERNERVLRLRELLCTTRLDKIAVQFRCEQITAVEYQGRPAFSCVMPEELLRLQRREYYRIEAPLLSPLKCLVATVREGAPTVIELCVHDISCGGIGVLTPPALFVPELGKRYDTTLHLPGASTLRDEMVARSMFPITLPSGTITQRSGFAFTKLPNGMLTSVQRYIMNLERLRKIGSHSD